MANVEALRNVLEFITAHPEKHDQETWWQPSFCGTTGCIAGWAIEQDPRWEFVYYSNKSLIPYGAVNLDSTTESDMSGAAQDILGLTWYEADLLFHGEHSLVDLWAIAEAITDGEVKVPEELRDQPYCEGRGIVMAKSADIDDYIRNVKDYLRSHEELPCETA